jgi:hypothetical protein
MKKLIILSSVLLSLVGCDSINGTLTVNEKINLKKKGGFLNLGRKSVSIEANEYDARLTILGQDNFALILDKGGNRVSIPLKSKKDLNVPTFDGEFKISHADIDQPYDLKGTIQTDISRSSTQESIEACTWESRETKCHIECQDVVTRDNRGVERTEKKCSKICEDYTITHHGRREVIFHYRTTHRDLNFLFLEANTEKSVANFIGQNTQTDKIIEHHGICN